mmetsp:Transcript_144921/g.449890  ORF Transcript_144921/g.449890 Transcript_144921/m.449890 type:complete len:379 (-) Transcript_144921:112-1248(-)
MSQPKAAMLQGCKSGRSALHGCRQSSLSRSPCNHSFGDLYGLHQRPVSSGDILRGRKEIGAKEPCRPKSAEARPAGRKGTKEAPAVRAVAPAEVDPEQLSRIWGRLLPASGAGPRAALFLDYDGTLREFETRPEQAVPTPEIMELLAALSAREDLALHIISGRDTGFLESHLGGLDRLTLVAEHGYRLRRPGAGRWEHWGGAQSGGEERQQRWKAILRPVLLQAIGEVPGSHLEEKASALVFHYREASAEAGVEAARALAGRLERLRAHDGLGDVRIACGQKVVEASFAGVSKGSVLHGLCEERRQAGQPFEAVLAVGDDKTDESMFASAPPDSVTIKVGAGDSRARFRVGSPRELRGFLRCIAAPRAGLACSSAAAP